jgi:hypothetical protein
MRNEGIAVDTKKLEEKYFSSKLKQCKICDDKKNYSPRRATFEAKFEKFEANKS